MKKPEVYLDMDGVLADFFHEYAKLAGVPADEFGKHDYRSIPPAKTDPTLNKMVGTDFFARLPKFPSADSLVAMVTKLYGGYNICSSPLRGDYEGSEKYKKVWIGQHLRPQPKNIIITPNKAKWAVQPDGTPNILIDDRGSNISSWEAAGGIGIKYQADEDRLDVITAGLTRARKILKGEEEHEPQKLVSKDRDGGATIATPDKEQDKDQETNEASYRLKAAKPGADNPDAPHVPIKGDEPVQRGDAVVAQDPHDLSKVHSGTVRRVGRTFVFITLKDGRELAVPHDEVSKHYEVLSNRANAILKKQSTTKEECGGVGIIASKKQAKDPRYSMSLTKDVRPGQVEKNLKAFSLAEGNELADALRAKEYIRDGDTHGYQKFLKQLRQSHGEEYSAGVHRIASDLGKKPTSESASAGATGSGSVASVSAQGGGWLFGGTVGAPKGAKKKKAKVIKR